MKRYLAEFLGTFFLAVAIIFTHNLLTTGLMFMAMVYLFGGVSGGHFNPAVSLGVWLRGQLSMNHFIGYFAAQTAGALLAALSFGLLTSQATALKAGAGQELFVTAGSELLLTFVFVGVVLVLLTTKKYAGLVENGMIIGLTLVAVASFPFGFYNPAVAVGAEVADLINGVSVTTVEAVLVHVLLPFVGGALAAWKVKCMYNNG